MSELDDVDERFLRLIESEEGTKRWAYVVPRSEIMRQVPRYNGSRSANELIQKWLIWCGAQEWLRQLVPDNMEIRVEEWVALGPAVDSP